MRKIWAGLWIIVLAVLLLYLTNPKQLNHHDKQQSKCSAEELHLDPL